MHNKCPNGYFSDDSQPIDQVKRPMLYIDDSLTIAQAMIAINVYLHLPTNFDWHDVPCTISSKKLTWSHAIRQAKIMALAADYTRPYSYNYPYPMDAHQSHYARL